VIPGPFLQLAAAGRASDTDLFATFACLVVLVGAPIALFGYLKVRTARAGESLARRNYEDNERRNQAAFEHNREAAKLNIEKQKQEIRLLALQVQIAEHELSSRRTNNYNDLATEKIRLEIESLRYHICDQRKGGLPDYDD
jgi:hypothetical protein